MKSIPLRELLAGALALTCAVVVFVATLVDAPRGVAPATAVIGEVSR